MTQLPSTPASAAADGRRAGRAPEPVFASLFLLTLVITHGAGAF